MRRLKYSYGYTLIELVAVIVIIGILAGIAVTKMAGKTEKARFDATLSEMEALTTAIIGNQNIYQQGAVTDFGYVGDVGSLPPNLDALVINPGFATWDGPYISSNFNSDDFKKDAWGAEYILSDTLLRSTGSGDNIEKVIAVSSAALLSNNISGFIRDADQNLPGAVYKDSFNISLSFPNGAGGVTTASTIPDASGFFDFAGVPIGHHHLSVIYLPDTDTVIYNLAVIPGRDVKLDIVFPADLW